MPEKTITMRIDDDLHTAIKVHVAKEGVSIKEYILDLIKRDLYGEKEK